MKKRILVLVVGFLLIGINGFAADGDLIVNGNATINGTLTVQGIKLTHVTGTNPTCPAGQGAFLMRKWTPQTCTDAGGGGCRSCTTSSGWGIDPFTCQYENYYVFEGSGGCVAATCSSLSWAEAVCVGN